MLEPKAKCFSDEKLKEMFVYHAPTENAKALHNEVNARAFEFAKWINDTLPRSPETTLAIRALSEARFHANHAIAIYVTAGVAP